jgi:hypothetical protein
MAKSIARRHRLPRPFRRIRPEIDVIGPDGAGEPDHVDLDAGPAVSVTNQLAPGSVQSQGRDRRPRRQP